MSWLEPWVVSARYSGQSRFASAAMHSLLLRRDDCETVHSDPVGAGLTVSRFVVNGKRLVRLQRCVEWSMSQPPRPPTVNFRSVCRTSSDAGAGLIAGREPSLVNSMRWGTTLPSATVGQAGAVRRLRRLCLRAGGAVASDRARRSAAGRDQCQMLATWWCFLLAGGGSLRER